MNRFRVPTLRRGIPIVGVSALLALALNVSPAAANVPFKFTVYIGGACIYAQGPINDHYILTVRDRDGQLLNA